MKVTRLSIENFRGIGKAEIHFSGHTLLIGGNNVGKSTICEALDLVLGPDRLRRNPPVEEYDFRNGRYLDTDSVTPVPIRIEVVLTDLTEDLKRQCRANLEFWHNTEQRILTTGEIQATENPSVQFCLRLATIASYDPEEDQFVAKTVYSYREDGTPDDEAPPVPIKVKRSIGFLYLRALRTGSRALTLERGSLLDTILRLKEVRTDLWERIRKRLANLVPPIDEDAPELGPILDEIEARLTEYIATPGKATRLFVSQLTREHLRKTISFFLSMREGEDAIPFYEAGTGTLNTLVLALLTFIADVKKDNIIFGMEEPEIALPPHTQRRIAQYLLTQTSQCFVTSHSPYIIERFQPESIMRLTRDSTGELSAIPVNLPSNMKAKTYRSQLRRAIAEAMLGQGVIVGEGITEQLLLTVVAKKLEEANTDLFPLDLAGVTVINTEGDGNLDSIGHFFENLEIPAFAFFDRKKRKPDEIEKIKASFKVAMETQYSGAEELAAAETPLARQWQMLEAIRNEDSDNRFKIPAVQPDPESLKDLTQATLRHLKGDGGAARLLELCAVDELPRSAVDFLNQVYEFFPRPKRQQTVQEGDKEGEPSPEMKMTLEPEGANPDGVPGDGEG